MVVMFVDLCCGGLHFFRDVFDRPRRIRHRKPLAAVHGGGGRRYVFRLVYVGIHMLHSAITSYWPLIWSSGALGFSDAEMTGNLPPSQVCCSNRRWSAMVLPSSVVTGYLLCISAFYLVPILFVSLVVMMTGSHLSLHYGFEASHC
ncbi:hypothetical protein Hanom_Chr06g00532231 [Helianthus anomalus]